MECADPILCYDNGRSRIFRHFSLASHVMKAAHQHRFNCGGNSPTIICLPCRKKAAAQLAMRCVLHASLYEQNSFLTLTYDEKKDGYHNELQYSDIQKFKKRLRQFCLRRFNRRLQVFNVHEYGKNGKKHWHLVVFNYDFSDDRHVHTMSNGLPLYTSKNLSKLWRHGFNTIGTVTEASAMYQAQYVQKDFKNGNTGEKKYNSKHSGIGRPYFLRHYEQILRLGYVPFSGRKCPVPRYFEKIAHKHYSHFYFPEAFEDTPTRKALHRKIKLDEANRHMADLYLSYHTQKQKHLEELRTEWENSIEEYIFTDKKPEFLQAGENLLHDMSNKTNNVKF